MRERNSSRLVNPAETQIDFVEVTHQYFVDGRELPSVSTIMQNLSRDYYADIHPVRLAKPANRRTRVHKAIEMFEKFGIEEEDEEIKPYLRNYKVAKKLKGFQVINTELMLTNHEFCGTLDMMALYKNELVIIDLKATSKLNTILREVQLAAYLELAIANGFDISKCYCLLIKEDSHKFVEVRPNVMLWEELKNEHKNQTHPD